MQLITWPKSERSKTKYWSKWNIYPPIKLYIYIYMSMCACYVWLYGRCQDGRVQEMLDDFLFLFFMNRPLTLKCHFNVSTTFIFVWIDIYVCVLFAWCLLLDIAAFKSWVLKLESIYFITMWMFVVFSLIHLAGHIECIHHYAKCAFRTLYNENVSIYAFGLYAYVYGQAVWESPYPFVPSIIHVAWLTFIICLLDIQ